MSKYVTPRERRAARKEQKMGGPAACVMCGETNPHCFEAHHVARARNHPATVITCMTCHRKVSDIERDHPDPLIEGDRTLETAGHLMLGLAALFEVAIEMLRDFGHKLIERAGSLHPREPDDHRPTGHSG